MKLGKELTAAKILAEAGVKNIQVSSKTFLELLHKIQQNELELLHKIQQNKEVTRLRVRLWRLESALSCEVEKIREMRDLLKRRSEAR